MTYTFTASIAGHRTYYSGTQGDLQVEMGLYGAIIVLPNAIPAGNCTAADLCRRELAGAGNSAEADFRLAHAAYDHPASCYDREYLFQFSEMDPRHPHARPKRRSRLLSALHRYRAAPDCSSRLPTEPYHPAYFLINGRSMPDDMDPNYAAQYPHQPYNGNPHMHPGELVLLRVIGQGRWQHPFHEHAQPRAHAGARRQPDPQLNAMPTDPQPRRTAAVHHHHDAGPDHGRDLLLHGQGPELGCVRPQRRSSTDADAKLPCASRCQRLQHR